MTPRKAAILQVIPSLAPGGAERMMMHLVAGLDFERYRVGVVSLSDRLGTDLETMGDETGADIRYLGKRSGFDPRMYWRFDRALREFKPDLIHAHLNALLYAAPPALVRGIPVVYTIHNYPELLVPRTLRSFYRHCFRGNVVPVSIARSLAAPLYFEFGITEPPFIPNGIPVKRYQHPRTSRNEWRRKEGYLESDVLFVCVARLSAQKNHELLVRAFAAMQSRDRERRQSSHLLLAGEGELREPLVELSRELGLCAQVHFLGNRTDIPELLAACDVFALSSTQEANPLCVMEAMAAGLPIISTAVGGVPDLVLPGHNGILVQPGKVADFAEALSELAGDGELRKSWGADNARQAYYSFDVSKMARAYDVLYCDLLHPIARMHNQAEGRAC